MAVNAGYTLGMVGMVAYRVLAMLGSNPRKKQKLIENVKTLLDTTVATLLSSFQSVAKVSCLFVGLCAPKTFFKDPSTILMRYHLDARCEQLIRNMNGIQDLVILKKLEGKNSNDVQNYKFDENKLANLTILKASFNYARRYGIANGTVDTSFLLRRDQRKKFNNLEKDTLDSRVTLYLAYKNLFATWKQNKDSITDDYLKDFFKNNFKTNRQKKVLQNFLTRRSITILNRSLFLNNTRIAHYFEKAEKQEFLNLIDQKCIAFKSKRPK